MLRSLDAYMLSDSWVRVPHPRDHKLPKSKVWPAGSSPESEVYAVSVLHQIHCIVSSPYSLLHHHIWLTFNNQGDLKHLLVEYEKDHDLTEMMAHATHCIEYLRQVVLLHAISICFTNCSSLFYVVPI